MSHRATNWAIQQRGLSPVTKLVLWHLCDRHNPDYGCFPSQDQLAADVEISRASLNVHLEKLEAAGLIRPKGAMKKARTNGNRPATSSASRTISGPSHVQILDMETGKSHVQISAKAMSRIWTLTL